MYIITVFQVKCNKIQSNKESVTYFCVLICDSDFVYNWRKMFYFHSCTIKKFLLGDKFKVLEKT